MRHDGHGSIEDDSIRHRQFRQLPPLLVLGELHGELSVGITSSIYSVRLHKNILGRQVIYLCKRIHALLV